MSEKQPPPNLEEPSEEETANDTSDGFEFRIDPDRLDESIKELAQQVQKLVGSAKHSRIRLTYRGRRIAPDIPVGAFVAGEVLSLLIAGPLRLVLMNFGLGTMLDVEVIHQADDKVSEGINLFLDGDIIEAETAYREAIRMRPDDTAAHYNLGVLLRVVGRRDEAITELEIAAADVEHGDAEKARAALEKMQRSSDAL
jgi:tetratricopeptide (TPR) repeat protein